MSLDPEAVGYAGNDMASYNETLGLGDLLAYPRYVHYWQSFESL
jgi:hypothetical protein